MLKMVLKSLKDKLIKQEKVLKKREQHRWKVAVDLFEQGEMFILGVTDEQGFAILSIDQYGTHENSQDKTFGGH